MRISNNLSYTHQLYYNQPKRSSHVGVQDRVTRETLGYCYKPSFTSISIKDNKGVPICSGFYRDYPTLFFVKDYIEKGMPNGTDIVVGACSTGEDLISIYSMLDSREKNTYLGIDLSKFAIELANKNSYGISSICEDNFLIDNACGKEAFLKERFLQIMSKGEKSSIDLNPHPFTSTDTTDIFCVVDDEHFKKMKFIQGDMSKIELKQPAGVIFFRNAFYQIANNNLHGTIYEPKFKLGHANKKELLRPIIENIHRNLKKDGILVIGTVVGEHIYLADKHLPTHKKVMIDEHPLFDELIDYNMANPEVEIYKRSPLYELLFENNRFLPIFNSEGSIDGCKFSVPTVWKKSSE